MKSDDDLFEVVEGEVNVFGFFEDFAFDAGSGDSFGSVLIVGVRIDN